MKKLVLMMGVSALLLCQSTASKANTPKQAEKDFCVVNDFIGKNAAFVTTRTTITYSVYSFGAILAALVNIEAQRANLAKGLDASRISLRALSWAGPLKAFGRAVIPLMDNSAKVIKAAKLDSKVSRMYKQVYTPLSYAWMTINTGLYGIQVAGVAVCKKANIMGVKVTRDGTKAAAEKFWALAQKYAGTLKQTVARLEQAKQVISPFGRVCSSVKSVLKPMESPLKKIETGLKLTNKAMKPVFVAAKALVKEMDKKRCITYSVKVKVKVKIKNGKFWKTKVKVKAKTQKFCFRISKVAGQIQKLAAVVQKPVNDIINKTIKPLMKKVEKGLKKALKLDGLTKFQKKLSSLGSKFSAVSAKLNGIKSNISSDLTALKRIDASLK